MRISSDPRRRPGYPFAACLSWLLALGLSGCGADDDMLLLPAAGKVTVDGKPISAIQVRFVRADKLGDMDAVRPFAVTDDAGAFRLGTRRANDGAPAARYKVTLFWPDRPPGPSAPRDLLGGHYSDASGTPIERTVAEGKPVLDPIEVEKPPDLPRSAKRTAPAEAPGIDPTAPREKAATKGKRR